MKRECSRCNQSSVEINSINEWISDNKIVPFLEKCYFDTLCNRCIEEIKLQISSTSTVTLPKRLIQGDHYYIENGKWVFTEKYHLQKNYCCNNECRHCPYGFKEP